jgi:hypothetical protein
MDINTRPRLGRISENLARIRPSSLEHQLTPETSESSYHQNDGRNTGEMFNRYNSGYPYGK